MRRAEMATGAGVSDSHELFWLFLRSNDGESRDTDRSRLFCSLVNPMRRFVRYTALIVISGATYPQLQMAEASSAPTDSVLFCGVANEQLRRDPPRPAAKRPANLNRGEPRTVRMIYFLPNDWSYRAEVVDSMKTVIREAQTFYREQMKAHGYGERTFRIETDARGEPLVNRVDGRHPFSHYDNTLGTAVVAELEETFDLDANIYAIILGTDALRQGNGKPTLGVGRRRTKNGGYLVVPDGFSFFTVAHELGHTFGLYHDFRDDAYIMSYGNRRRSVLSACAAEFLAVHTCFDHAIPIEDGQPPAVKLVSPNRYQPGTTSVPVRLQVSDPKGLHQVGLIGSGQWCRKLAGEKDAVVEFQYKGGFGQRGFNPLADRRKHHLFVVALDAGGNVSENAYSLAEMSPHEIVTLRSREVNVTSVAFSPDGSRLAYGTRPENGHDAKVYLWNVKTGESIPMLSTKSVTWVAFSRDGTLAAGFLNRTTLVDVSTRTEIATFPGGGPLAFSHDGTLLASHGPDGITSIGLWDVSRRKEVGVLRRHKDQINALAFSSDGALLASGSGNGRLGDDSVRLWQVADQEEIARIQVPGHGVWSVAFSPDRRTLAWGSANGGATLWDVANRSEVAFFKTAGPPVVFFPDGATLACDAGDGAISLWDVASQEKLFTLTGESPDVNSMSISPDGKLLASGSWFGGTITLWDVSEWSGPRPSTLEIISGDSQRGVAGSALADSLGVRVRDQLGNPLPGVSVNFKITAGDGALSDTTATTDENGRASVALILGEEPGTNAVAVSVANLEPVTFAAVATARSDFDGDGTVGFSDFVQFAAQFGSSEGEEGYDVRFDLDGNGAVGFSDFVIFASAFEKA